MKYLCGQILISTAILWKKALQLSGLTTKREVVEKALSTLVRLEEQQQLRELRGKLVWDDDLDRMRGAE